MRDVPVVIQQLKKLMKGQDLYLHVTNTTASVTHQTFNFKVYAEKHCLQHVSLLYISSFPCLKLVVIIIIFLIDTITMVNCY